MQMRKCCNHPYLFSGVEDRSLDPHGEHVIENCGKLVLLDKLLKRLYEKGHRVLIFSQMTRMIDVLEDYLWMRQYKYCRIDGKTNYEVREDSIASYNAPNSDKFVFLLSTRAGGLGINLQTADTVVLYDSDWNPQADLQAQDRAHRIGQKRPVHVYRLVTEFSIEEKVVERAHQKLKLDAMVVQQGRLQDKEKKLTKDDMLAAIKFGADQVFRSSESSITDADIETIIARGDQRTKELAEKLQDAEKGDVLDFKLDGSLPTQEWEGVDYSDAKNRQGGGASADLASLMAIDQQMDGDEKRQRKPVTNYNEDAYYRQNMQVAAANSRVKLPKHLRLPKMEEWQFYNVGRLKRLFAMEEQRYVEMKMAKELPANIKSVASLLMPEEALEKETLLKEGFGSWSRQDWSTFTKASAKYGRSDYLRIALEVGKQEDEVKRYALTFWEQGPDIFSEAEMERITRIVEKGERKLNEIQRLTDGCAKFISRFPNPLSQLAFRYVGTHGHVFGVDEDRYLLFFTNKHGYGNWAKVRAEIRACPRFKFDYFLRSLNATDLGKRCETLMREATKELTELERRMANQEEQRKKLGDEVKEQVASTEKVARDAAIANGTATDAERAAAEAEAEKAESSSTSHGLSAGPPSGSSNGGRSAMPAHIHNTAEAAAIAERRARLFLEKQRQDKADAAKAKAEAEDKARARAEEARREADERAAKGQGPKKPRLGGGGIGGGLGASAEKSERKPRPATDGSGRDSGKYVVRPVTEQQLPELLKIIHEKRMDSLQKLVHAFITAQPTCSKRQVELKVQEVAEKLKRPTGKAWYLKREYEEKLNQYIRTGAISSGGDDGGGGGDGSQGGSSGKSTAAGGGGGEEMGGAAEGFGGASTSTSSEGGGQGAGEHNGQAIDASADSHGKRPRSDSDAASPSSKRPRAPSEGDEDGRPRPSGMMMIPKKSKSTHSPTNASSVGSGSNFQIPKKH
mmetsp:Transcript_72436/g.206187  ORF Transcript_72436/g.206187 Transcript_72436/m.206187 type:complete len:969 (+) Transcript_72436:1339-4245(+)